ncbi:transposase [Solibacillus sp. FSL K6-4121]|uniref:transposase n=1 Tax=Solibacillus sp. FSL K6-4121 TaxID=2921505 RepID=UPI0030FB881F
MKIILVVSSIIVPLIMVYIRNKISKSAILFNILAVIFVIIFGSIASTSIYQIIIDDAVFMTKIHGLFLNELFLISGAYIGIFVIYRLMVLTMKER